MFNYNYVLDNWACTLTLYWQKSNIMNNPKILSVVLTTQLIDRENWYINLDRNTVKSIRNLCEVI